MRGNNSIQMRESERSIGSGEVQAEGRTDDGPEIAG